MAQTTTSGRNKWADDPNRNNFELFDRSEGYEEEGSIQLAPNLSETDKRLARTLYRVFTPPREAVGLWGLCIVKGAPGAGKDTFTNWLAYTIKRYFPWKRIMRDTPPRELFGAYAGLFNEKVLHDVIEKMKVISKGQGLSAAEAVAAKDKFADDWVNGAGQVMLKNALLHLEEYWNYCYKRSPHAPMNTTMGAIHRVKRHLDCLIVGAVQLIDDLDKFTCKPFVDWQVTCTRATRNPTGFVYYVQPVKYDRRLDVLVPTSTRPFPIPLDAGEPRKELGDGKIRLTERGWQYEPETEEERVVLEVIKYGVDDYEDLVAILEDEGDMSPSETLMTLKELGLKLPNRRPKMVIDYPCYFKIFNSKNATNIRSSV